MIKYDPAKKELSLSEWITWEDHVRPIYQEVYQDFKDDLEVTEDTAEDFSPIPPEQLSSEEIDDIMEEIRDRWEFEDYRCGDYAAASLYECIRPAVQEWCEDNFHD